MALAGLGNGSFSGRVDIPGCHTDGLWPGFHGFCTSLSHSWEEMSPGLHSQSWVFTNIISDLDWASPGLR